MKRTARAAAAITSCLLCLQCTNATTREDIENDEGNATEVSMGLTAPELRNAALKLTRSLKSVAPPEPPNFSQYVKDRLALQIAGKALFWDQQIGSDGQACASCHMHAGADNRSRNQVNPGLIAGDPSFSPSSSGTGSLGANHQLVLADFPLHRVAAVNDPGSAVLYDTNDSVSSQGVMNGSFVGLRTPLDPKWPADIGVPVANMFMINGAKVNNVEPRNSPSVINSALNQRNFWDGRARGEFNGINNLGSLDAAKAVKITGIPRRPTVVSIQIEASSAASQAVAPPLSDLEMSFSGRQFADVGRKLLAAKPLAKQTIAPTDSLLGGVTLTTYADLFKQAINLAWWDAPAGWFVDLSTTTPTLVRTGSATPGPNQYTVMEYNFGLFFGLAVNEYEKLLLANDSRFDQFLDGNVAALSPQELDGLSIFLGKGLCIRCHGGPELTNAGVTTVQGFDIIKRMLTGNGHVGVYDHGFYNIGVRPTDEDLGLGGRSGPQNKPLSNARNYQECVRDMMAANPLYSLAQANIHCNVPRILATPAQAIPLLSRAAALVGSPANVLALLDTANELLAEDPPDILGASCALSKNLILNCRSPGAIDLLVPLGSSDDFTTLLSEARSLLPDQANPGKPPQLLAPLLAPFERVAVDGSFKTPGLRNVELTAPYFHNGGQATLEQVVDFYNRGGDFANQNRDNLDLGIGPLGLTSTEKSALVAFLRALTDERVRGERAPFDHPSLDIPNGGALSTPKLRDFGQGTALVWEDRVLFPAVGSAGCAPACENGLGTPNTPFANFLQKLTP